MLKQSKRIAKKLITNAKIRAASALLRWSAEALAKNANIGIATIRRFEIQDGIPSGQIRILDALKSALETAGVTLSPCQSMQSSLFTKQSSQ